MTLKDAKRKALTLIEEYNPDSEFLTDDPDIATKLCDVINQVMYELAGRKKIPKFISLPVLKNEVYSVKDLSDRVGATVYQIEAIHGVAYDSHADNTVFLFKEDGNALIDLFVYPKRITEETPDSYELELSDDAAEIMPYGVAADLLKSDVSSSYGQVYAKRYNDMLQWLDPRNQLYSARITGGVKI